MHKYHYVTLRNIQDKPIGCWSVYPQIEFISMHCATLDGPSFPGPSYMTTQQLFVFFACV